MEVFAGDVEHTDTQVGRLIDGIDARGPGENADLLHLRRQWFGRRRAAGLDQRSPGAEQHPEHGRAADRGAGQDRRAGGARRGATDNMYHAGWAWLGGTPFKGTKLMGAYFGGTRNPMVIVLARTYRA